MADTFSRTLQSVVSGARQLEEFSHVLVQTAVEDALLCVARDYGHEYSALLARYRDLVVRRHASGSLTEKTQCRGVTKGGKPCGRRAQLQGYCQTHAAQMAEEEAKRRRVEAYRASVPRREPEGALVELWLGRKHVSGETFRVPIRDCVLGLL